MKELHIDGQAAVAADKYAFFVIKMETGRADELMASNNGRVIVRHEGRTCRGMIFAQQEYEPGEVLLICSLLGTLR